MTDPIVWPTRLLVPANMQLRLTSASLGGGQAIDGSEQVVASPMARWTATLSGIAIRNPDQVLVLRSIEAMLDGRAGTLLMPIYDYARNPTRSGPDGVLTSWSDGGTMSDGTLFSQPSYAASVTTAAAVNATSLSIKWAGVPPRPGMHFALGNRLHRIARLMVSSATTGVVTIRPWLRQRVPANTLMNFDDPLCLMRLAKDDGLSMDLQLWRFATLSVDFVEAL